MQRFASDGARHEVGSDFVDAGGPGAIRAANCSGLSFLAEREYPFRLVDGILGTGVRVAQESLRSARMRVNARVAARHRCPESGPDHFFSEGDEGAAQTKLYFPIAATELRGQFLGQALLLPVGHEDDGGTPCAPGDLIVGVAQQGSSDRGPCAGVLDLGQCMQRLAPGLSALGT
jgi:hypothetical protein